MPLQVRLQYVQMYLEHIYDVLCPEKGPLPMREEPAGGVCVPGATNALVTTEREALELLEQACYLLATYVQPTYNLLTTYLHLLRHRPLQVAAYRYNS